MEITAILMSLILMMSHILIIIVKIKIGIRMIIREWVVTAAHCMRGENWRKLKVVLGELDRRDKYETENR